MVLLPVFQHGLHALDKLLEVSLHLPLVLVLLLSDETLVLDEGILTELAELLEAHLELLVQVGLLCRRHIPQEDLGYGVRPLHSKTQQRGMEEGKN